MNRSRRLLSVYAGSQGSILNSILVVSMLGKGIHLGGNWELSQETLEVDLRFPVLFGHFEFGDPEPCFELEAS